MIYAVVGLIILVVSFILALFSLIREQNQVKTFTQDEPDFEKTDLKKSEIVQKSALPSAKKFAASSDSSTQKPALNPLEDEVPFYWLKNSSPKEELENESENARIERIRKQLENIKISLSSLDRGNKGELQFQTKKKTVGRLSGGFTIEELKKQMI